MEQESNPDPVVVWMRQDLRLEDNPALMAASETGRPIIPLYILDDENSGEWKMGGASRWWLNESLRRLNDRLEGKLCLKRGDAAGILSSLAAEHRVHAVFWNRCYEPWRIRRDTALKQALLSQGVEARSFNGSLLFEPTETVKDDGAPYRVFTPYYNRNYLGIEKTPRIPLGRPARLSLFPVEGLELDQLSLLPGVPWHLKLDGYWEPGEEGAYKRLDAFLDRGLKNYEEGRNYPAADQVSRLSPHLHFGEISPHTVWHAVSDIMKASRLENDGEKFLRELGWREFSYSLLYHFPDLPRQNFQDKFDAFPWGEDEDALKRWQRGQTGYPIVDAGMRELWETGYMHNRVRMIVGSFLVKNLQLHWHHGEEWFWDTLVDADLANNSASWQWVAGSGADAAPYFRIFNPVTQSRKFDAKGEYIRRYVPEIAALPDRYLHSPWEAPDDVLKAAGIAMGRDYPRPMVDLKQSRAAALQAFSNLK